MPVRKKIEAVFCRSQKPEQTTIVDVQNFLANTFLQYILGMKKFAEHKRHCRKVTGSYRNDSFTVSGNTP